MVQQEALERLALVEPHELSGEAKAEICRATRDLRSCGRSVHRLLSCGHACLCVECRQRCDSCPICRAPVTNSVPDKPRLYDQCLEAGLIREDNSIHSESNDIRRLCSFFDVALENNFVSLVCHCIHPLTFQITIWDVFESSFVLSSFAPPVFPFLTRSSYLLWLRIRVYKS